MSGKAGQVRMHPHVRAVDTVHNASTHRGHQERSIWQKPETGWALQPRDYLDILSRKQADRTAKLIRKPQSTFPKTGALWKLETSNGDFSHLSHGSDHICRSREE